ncbi:MAG: hypothetical protein Q9226_003315 [Calogaya cf. arnoldii]
MLRQVFLSIFCLALTLHPATADVESSAECQKLSEKSRNNTVLPSQNDYLSLSTENWSETAWAKPSCIFRPRGTSEVQEVVEILANRSIPFAIRSGGHMPSPLAANINDGVLIDMSMLNEVEYNAAKNQVKVGAGQRWGDVYKQLDAYNVTVVGGRVLEVGVGGLILGCGLSYLSDLHGLACDNVVNFEVRLDTGSSLKVLITEVWGGTKLYSLDHLPDLFSAMIEYQSNPNKDPYANLFMQAFTTNASIGAVVNLVYLKPEASPLAFSPFYSIPTVNDTTKIQTLTQMISGQMVPPFPRFDWFATSFKPDASLYSQIEKLTTTAPELGSISSLTAGSLALGLQPISSSVVAAGRARGGNALNLEAIDQTWFVLDIAYWFPEHGQAAHDSTRRLHTKIENITKDSGKYLPYQFMNDASYDQEVIRHYGEVNVQRLRSVQKKYDAELVFQKLVPGGFKLP